MPYLVPRGILGFLKKGQIVSGVIIERCNAMQYDRSQHVCFLQLAFLYDHTAIGSHLTRMNIW